MNSTPSKPKTAKQVVVGGFLDGFEELERLSVTEWAERDFQFSAEGSAEPGFYDRTRAPYQAEMMDCIYEDGVTEIIYETSAQVGKTTALLIIVGYNAVHKPAPMLLVEPTLDMAKAFSQERLDPAIRDCPAMSKAFARRKSRSGENSILKKSFVGGQITVAGANSAASLRMRAVKIVFCDEVDAYPPSVDGEGDAVSLAKKRTVTFGKQARTICSSTPVLKQTSQIHRRFKAGDQRYFRVPCPHCDEFQVLEWKAKENGGKPSNIHWTPGKPETAEYECEHCHGLLDGLMIKQAVQKGHWQATQPFNGIISFHIWEIYSPWRTLAEIVADYEKAEGNPTLMQTFWNTSLGEPWEGQMRGTVEAKTLLARVEQYVCDVVPERAFLLTAAADVQHDRIEAMIIAWGLNDERWVMNWQRFLGDPTHTGELSVWAQLEAWLSQRLPHRAGYQHPGTHDGRWPVEVVAVDSGFATQKVYGFCAQQIAKGRLWWPIKGVPGMGRPLWSLSEERLKNNVKLYIVGVDSGKSEIASCYEVTAPGENYIHFNEKLDLKNFERMTNEKLLLDVTPQGFPKYTWTLPDRKQNEDFDLLVYNLAARRSVADNTIEVRMQSLSREVRAEQELSAREIAAKFHRRAG